jgi:hypothetical protein
MTLGEPQLLWALLVLPLLWWLSQPPKPRQHVLTAHMQQWQLAMRALRRRPPRGSSLRWLLLSLAAVGAILAAAGPHIPAAPGPKQLVVLLDGSLSMSSTVSGRSAFDQAKSLVMRELRSVPDHVEVTVLRCGGELRRRYGSSARLMNDLGEASGPLEVDLVSLAKSAAEESRAVWTITDGQGQEELPAVGALTVLDTAGANAAILSVRLEDAWPLPAARLQVEVVAHAKPAQDGTVAATLRVSGAITNEQQMSCSLRPGVPETLQVSLLRAKAGGEVVLDLQVQGDHLLADHVHTLQLSPLPAPRIAALIDGDAGPFAAAAADALAEEVGGEVVAAEAGVEAGLLLVDGGYVPLEDEQGNLAKRRALTFGSRLSETAEVKPWLAPTPLGWSRTSPLTQGLDLSELQVDRAWRGILPDGEAFLWRNDGELREPLGVVVDGGRLEDGSETASVHLAFRLQDSNLPLLAAFPQLLRRSFVRSYGEVVTEVGGADPPPAGEQDLLHSVRSESRPLPEFGGKELSLARWFVLAGLLMLAVRAFVR